MGTTAQKLNKILETKEAIRTAINNKGGTLTTTDTFASYPSAIDSLPSGGDLKQFYKELFDISKSANSAFNGYVDNITPYYYITDDQLKSLISYDSTSNVTSTSKMFFNCSYITTIPQLDTSKVTNMKSMFSTCTKLTTIPQLDTSKVTNMSGLFEICFELESIPQLDTSKVTNMSYMFNSCHKLTKIDITHMNITSTSKNSAFAYDCNSLTKLIIRNMNSIPALASDAFSGCYHFTGTTDSTYNPQGLKDGRIYVPDDKVDALKTATNWSTYADIIVPLSTLIE